MKTILVLRFSAFGDVILAYHTIKAFLNKNPDYQIVFLTKPHFGRIFHNEHNVIIPKIDFSSEFKGILGLWKLAKKINEEYEFDIVLDLHNVLRSRILSLFFKLRGKKIYRLDKGRKEKRELTRRRRKNLRPLKHTTERYADVFKQAGLDVDLYDYNPQLEIPKEGVKDFVSKLKKPIVAVAPFAKHKTKMYPLDKMEIVLKELSQKYHILIFGGGENEQAIAEKWEKKYAYVHSIIGKFNLNEELALLDSCAVLVTMDSANMHLASLTKAKIVSIWGGTHPYLGFTPFKKFDPNLTVQVNLPCRPCSVFGKERCYRGDFDCLNFITPQMIVEKVELAINMEI